MRRILVINPNSSERCSAGIDAALAASRFAGGPELSVETLRDGPPAILTWQDWHAAVGPICRRIASTAPGASADAYVIACASDPGVEAARAVAPAQRPVFGVFRCAVAAAIARTERFGVIAIVSASKARHLAALRAMGLEARLVHEEALDASMDELLDPLAARARLQAAAQACVNRGAGAVVLGCTGMAHHRAAVENACGVPVIEPCQAAAAQAIAAVLAAAS